MHLLFSMLQIDPEGAFSQTPYGILHIEDIRAYIYCKYDILGIDDISTQMEYMTDNGVMREEHKHINQLSIMKILDLCEFDEDEWFKILLSRVHDQFIWIGDKLVKICSDLIHEITGLDNTGVTPIAEKHVKKEVETLTHSKWDRRAMIVNDIFQQDVRLIAMILGYKFYYSSRPNSVSVGVIMMAWRMVKENVKYNLCEVLAQQFLENVKLVKKDRTKTFIFGSLLMHMFIHIEHKFPGLHPSGWKSGIPTVILISQSYK